MKKYFALLILLALVLTGCNPARKFDSDWMIGKDAQDIMARYGQFDAGRPGDAVYRNCQCSYYIKQDTKGKPGDVVEDQILRILFDDNGKAYKVYEETVLRRVTLPGQYPEPIWAMAG